MCAQYLQLTVDKCELLESHPPRGEAPEVAECCYRGCERFKGQVRV